MELYNISNLSYSYPGSDMNALSDISLKINKGEFVILCGSSGSGKSTLLNLMKAPADAGTQKGKISFGGSFCRLCHTVYGRADRLRQGLARACLRCGKYRTFTKRNTLAGFPDCFVLRHRGLAVLRLRQALGRSEADDQFSVCNGYESRCTAP